MSSTTSSPSRLVSDELWTTFETVVPRQEVPLHGRTGRPRTPDRQVLEGIAYVLTTGIAWTKVPEDLGCSGWTCWRRMHEWEKLGVFIQLHQSLVEKFGEQGEREWSRAGLDALMRRMGPAGRSGSPSHAA